MNRSDALRLLYPKAKTASEFNFDMLFHPPIMCYLTLQDVAQLNKIATSVRLSSKPEEKYRLINRIMTDRGFVKMASGTNRVVYRFQDDYSFVLKIAIDRVGCRDNPMELQNQHLLKPILTNCFDVTRCGTVGMFERVVPITYREEFLAIADDVFNLINNMVGKYVIDDIGEKYYQNYGIRDGFGPVLLDYPYVYELDGAKLRCNTIDPITNLACLGEIDYDIGYNDLICKKCGKRYIATDLKTTKSGDAKIIVEGKDDRMKISLMRGNEVVSRLGNTRKAVDTIKAGIRSGKLNSISLVTETEPEVPEKILPHIKTEIAVGFHPSIVTCTEDNPIENKKVSKVQEKFTTANLADVIDQYIMAGAPIPESIKNQIRGTELEKMLHSEKDEAPKDSNMKEERVSVSLDPTNNAEPDEVKEPDTIVNLNLDDSSELEAAVDLHTGKIIECKNGIVIASLIPTQLERFRNAINAVNNKNNDNKNKRDEIPKSDEKEVEHVTAEEVLPAEDESDKDLDLSPGKEYTESGVIETVAKEIDSNEKKEKSPKQEESNSKNKNIPQSTIEESSREIDTTLMSSSFNVETVVGRKIREAFYTAPKKSPDDDPSTVKLVINERQADSEPSQEEKEQINKDF